MSVHLPCYLYTITDIADELTTYHMIVLVSYILCLPSAVDCGEELSGVEGTISSPNYPHSDYPINTVCVWTISTTDGSRIGLNHTDFDVEHHDNCIWDYVKASYSNNLHFITVHIVCNICKRILWLSTFVHGLFFCSFMRKRCTCIFYFEMALLAYDWQSVSSFMMTNPNMLCGNLGVATMGIRIMQLVMSRTSNLWVEGSIPRNRQDTFCSTYSHICLLCLDYKLETEGLMAMWPRNTIRYAALSAQVVMYFLEVPTVGLFKFSCLP